MKQLNWFQKRWLDIQRMLGIYKWNFNRKPERDEFEFDRIDREW